METAEQCLKREAKEEIGAEVHLLEFIGTFTSTYGDPDLRTIGVAFICAIDGQVHLSGENDNWSWFDLDKLPKIAFSDVKQALQQLTANFRPGGRRRARTAAVRPGRPGARCGARELLEWLGSCTTAFHSACFSTLALREPVDMLVPGQTKVLVTRDGWAC